MYDDLSEPFWSLSILLIESKLYSGTVICRGLYDLGVKLRLSLAVERSPLWSFLLSSLKPNFLASGLRMLQYSVESVLCNVPGDSISLILARSLAIGVEQALEKSLSCNSCRCSYCKGRLSGASPSETKYFSVVKELVWFDWRMVS